MSLKKVYDNLPKGAFWFCLTMSVGLIVTSFFLPPQGVVDPSVLAAVGEIFAFATLATVIDGIHRGSDVSITKGDVNVTLNNPDKKE